MVRPHFCVYKIIQIDAFCKQSSLWFPGQRTQIIPTTNVCEKIDGDSVCTNPPRLQRNCFRRFVDLLQYILNWTTGTTDHFLYVLQGSQVSRWTKVCAKIIICCCSVRIFENHCGAVANGDDGMAYQSSGTCCSSSAEHKVLAQTVFLQASSWAFLWQQRTAAHGH